MSAGALVDEPAWCAGVRVRVHAHAGGAMSGSAAVPVYAKVCMRGYMGVGACTCACNDVPYAIAVCGCVGARVRR